MGRFPKRSPRGFPLHLPGSAAGSRGAVGQLCGVQLSWVWEQPLVVPPLVFPGAAHAQEGQPAEPGGDSAAFWNLV